MFPIADSGWTLPPGVLMETKENGLNEFKVTASDLEFVLNNGGKEWDHLNSFSDSPQNYHIQEPGTYYLKSGRLQRQ